MVPSTEGFIGFKDSPPYALKYSPRGLLYSVQNTFKKDPGRARQSSLATAGTNFTKPGAQNKGDLCRVEQKDPTWLVNKSPLQADLLPRSVGRSKEEEFNYRGIVLYYTILSF